MSSDVERPSTSESISKSSKKRKHDGTPKESRKKHKPLDFERDIRVQDETKSKDKVEYKKEKKRKNKSSETAEDRDTTMLTNGGTGGLRTSERKDNKNVDSNTSTTSRASHRKDDRVAKVDGEDRLNDSGVELPAEDASLISTAKIKKDKEKRKRAKASKSQQSPSPEATFAEPMLEELENGIEPSISAVEDQEVDKMSVDGPEASDRIFDLLDTNDSTSFYSTRLSLYLSIPPVTTLNPLPGVLSLHLTPLLLTYFPPAEGVVLSYYDPVLSARPEASLNKPLAPPNDDYTLVERPTEIFTKIGDEVGACWAWLTVTFLVFKPEQGNELKGWMNVMSEGFIGIVCYNYFQAAVSKARIPGRWTWTGARGYQKSSQKAAKRGKLNEIGEVSQDDAENLQDNPAFRRDDDADAGIGTFVDASGTQISETTTFRVVDLEVVPAADRGKWSLQIEGTLLDEDEEAEVRSEERQKFEDRVNRSRSRSRLGTTLMSGGLPSQSRASSILSTA